MLHLITGLILTAGCICLTTPSALAADIPLGGIGYRYDGTGIVDAGSRTPTGKLKLRWRIPTANWGYSSPVEIGDQVLVMCEPGSEELLYPTLVSYDRATGKERWRTTIDPLLARGVSASQRKAIDDDMRYWYETWRFAYQTAFPLAKGKHKRLSADTPELKAIISKLAKRGLGMKEYRRGYGLLRYLQTEGNPRFHEIYKGKYKKDYGLGTYTWQLHGHEQVGQCFPSPVSDGQHIVVTTDQSVVACLDMAGTISWIKATDYRNATMGNVGSSPRIADGKAIFNMGSRTYAYDLKTGKELWAVGHQGNKHSHGHGTYSSPLIADIDGTRVVIDGQSRVIRLADGKWLDLKTDEGVAVTGTFAKAGGSSEFKNKLLSPCYYPFSFDRTTQEFFGPGTHLPVFNWPKAKATKKGVLGFRGFQLSLTGDVITATPNRKLLEPGSRLSLAYRSKIYSSGKNGGVRDRVTGALQAGKGQVPGTRMILMIANDHVYGMKAGRDNKARRKTNVVAVCSTEGKKTGEFHLPEFDPETDPQVKKVYDQGIIQGHYACPMNLGRDCIYARDPSYLYCLE